MRRQGRATAAEQRQRLPLLRRVRKVRRLAQRDAVLLAARRQVLSRQHERRRPALLARLRRARLSLHHRVVRDVGDELVRRERDEPRDALVGALEARAVEEVLRHLVGDLCGARAQFLVSPRNIEWRRCAVVRRTMGLYVSMLRSSSSALRVSSDAAAAEEEEAAMTSAERSARRRHATQRRDLPRMRLRRFANRARVALTDAPL